MGKYVMYSSLPILLTLNSAATSRSTKERERMLGGEKGVKDF